MTQPDTSADLDDQRQSAFRTALGTAMYMSHERWDIQYCVKSLASFMRNPTEHAERCLIQLLLYLKGTADLSFRMLYTPVGSRMATKLNHVLDLEPDEDHVMEVFLRQRLGRWSCSEVHNVGDDFAELTSNPLLQQDAESSIPEFV